ncbi:hypothetical protein GMDG_02019 [Pseudogymnoascus destructans 20631-21]|uniref:Uncharacterized protein n=1 Tax=Pseudogymnoascus destructans (strain ATCC MYA-4855 / 20631-21) TaxID=658429 RepID=L8FYR6_PSED2|nr:hypothetical protein GMDG_02019 [Pseudogymnoascus destructans 20631-21]
MDAILPYLPQHAGFLPKWMLFTSIVAIGNSVQSFVTLYYTRRIYNIDPARPKALPATPSAPVPHSPLVTPFPLAPSEPGPSSLPLSAFSPLITLITRLSTPLRSAHTLSPSRTSRASGSFSELRSGVRR